MGRLGTAEEVADVIVVTASPVPIGSVARVRAGPAGDACPARRVVIGAVTVATAALSGLFGDGLTEGDMVSFYEAAGRKMMESDVLRNQAAANTKEQFVHSPALPDELMNAIMDTMAVHQSMSRQALNSDAIRAAMLATMLAQGGLWEAFRQRSDALRHA